MPKYGESYTAELLRNNIIVEQIKALLRILTTAKHIQIIQHSNMLEGDQISYKVHSLIVKEKACYNIFSLDGSCFSCLWVITLHSYSYIAWDSIDSLIPVFHHLLSFNFFHSFFVFHILSSALCRFSCNPSEYFHFGCFNSHKYCLSGMRELKKKYRKGYSSEMQHYLYGGQNKV